MNMTAFGDRQSPKQKPEIKHTQDSGLDVGLKQRPFGFQMKVFFNIHLSL